jgi:hypothetical protein
VTAPGDRALDAEDLAAERENHLAAGGQALMLRVSVWSQA